MPFCAACETRPARCTRRCQRIADGAHLWKIVQAEMLRGKPGADMPHLAFERQSEDVRRAFIVGAQAMREMAR